ncbi:hypothetical protein [Mycolicibacterium fortuitum]|uniref:hypothetical protein n=1 Tax=Mycolicibacterium fortuitum TaxID=1766 RepID=UPI00096C6B8C|nr:hypothetical protein [Mycolicibacterium fortuitum]OMC13383.1 hypothetical protein A5734_19880 [Mycolicibacterium fortuitum]
MASFLVLHLVVRSDALTSNLMDGRYPSDAQAMRGSGTSVALAVVGYGVLIRAALVGYLPAALFVCVIAFQ